MSLKLICLFSANYFVSLGSLCSFFGLLRSVIFSEEILTLTHIETLAQGVPDLLACWVCVGSFSNTSMLLGINTYSEMTRTLHKHTTISLLNQSMKLALCVSTVYCSVDFIIDGLDNIFVHTNANLILICSH